MFEQYVLEREGFRYYKDPESRGFALYRINGEECYIKDIYVKPEFRKSKVASELADQICVWAKEEGATYLAGTVSLMVGDPATSMMVLLRYGMKPFRYDNASNLLVFTKKL